ncbi:hypothetical protein MACK_002299 [Theileria orientalis]|uniref:Intron-binding protein aquarius n=1 Tax=Theileria orientalis TaxID=68886 RepID=A0A976MDL0_THEOR|nr:hypothetical protein MACK_002299 [Theileria orientalis]
MNSSLRPKLATLDELLSHDFYKRLVASAERCLPEVSSVKGPKQLASSQFGKEIVEIYKTLFSGGFNKLDMASLEHSDYLSHLLPCLSTESFPLIANIDSKSQEAFKRVRYCSVMTCVWCFVESHSSGRSEYVDVLSNVSSKHKDSFEALFFNAAQLLMVESWNEELCEARDFDSVDRVTVLEQRALLRFLIICFQRIELVEVRRCCMSLLSPQVWIHIPEELREANFFKNNRISKMLFLKAFENYKIRHDACNFTEFLEKSQSVNGKVEADNSVRSVYKVVPNDSNIKNLNASYRLILSRDFINSIINQFVFILEDCLSFSDDLKNKKNKSKSEDSKKVDDESEIMKLMYIENYLELFVDLLSQLHLRRIIKPIIEYRLILVRCKNHVLYQSVDANSKVEKEEGSIFVELVNILEYYLNFNINEELGVNMDYNVILEEYYKRFNKFQRICYLNYKEDENLKNIHLINNYSLNTNLSNILSNLDIGILVQLNQKLLLIPSVAATNANSTVDNSTAKDNSNGKGTTLGTDNNNATSKDVDNNATAKGKNREERLNGCHKDYLWPYSIELTPKKKKSKKLVKRLLISNLITYLKKPINELVLINKNNFYLNPFSSLFNSTTVVNPEVSETTESMESTEALELVDRRVDGEMIEIEEDMNYIKLSTLSLFKLNLQYLTLFDYLYRNFILYQFEIIYQIKQYIQQQVFILFSFSSQKPRFSRLGTGVSGGDSSEEESSRWVGRMFMGISGIAMSIVNKRIEMTVTLDLSLVQDYKIRQEWQQLTKYDILYLIQLKPNYSRFSTGNKEHDELLWGKDVRKIRFGEIVEVLDEENNNVLEFNPLDNKSFMGFKMRVKLLLDYEQYMKDIQEDLDYYSSFNLVIRRSKRQNNFKAILTNVQNVLNHRIDIPNWLQIVLLGYIHNITNEKRNIGSSKNTGNDVTDEGVSAKRRKYSSDKVGINYLNTFKSKQHLLSTTQFISIKLVPVLGKLEAVNVSNHDHHHNDNDYDNDYDDDKTSSKRPSCTTGNSKRTNCTTSNIRGRNSTSNDATDEKLELKENRLYIDTIDNDLNAYIYSNKRDGNKVLNKRELKKRVKMNLLNNDNVSTFIRNHIVSHPYNTYNKYTDSDDDEDHGDERLSVDHVVIDGVKFELYVEDSYLKGLNKLSNNYYVNDNQLPKFLISNFSDPYEVKFSKHSSTDNNTSVISNANSNNTSNAISNIISNTSSNITSNAISDIISNAISDNSVVGMEHNQLHGTNVNIKFVNKQIESIVNGTLEGLTVIMGPPGTGKTDVVSQIISILFNNFEHEKIVICTHSNFALDDIFTKLVKNELIDEHYMVRLGHSDLEVDQMGHFTKFGRVNYILQRRLDLLEVVKALKEQLNIMGDYESSIQYSLTFLQYYFLNTEFSNMGSEGRDNGDNYEVLEKEMKLLEGLDKFFRLELSFSYTLKDVRRLYEQIQVYNNSVDLDGAVEVEEGIEVYVEGGVVVNDDYNDHDNNKNHYHKKIWKQLLAKKKMYKKFLDKLYGALNELLPFEILRNNRDRMKYLVENYSRIVAMTCTHASIAKEELATLNYKSLVFEEAAQILEIESFIPICNNIKRLVLCGDHLQLSPIIQNAPLQKYSNLSQSLFLRLIRLNYPYVQLNMQARSKGEILNVYKNFYPNKIYTLGEDELSEDEVASDKTPGDVVKRDGVKPDGKGKGKTTTGSVPRITKLTQDLVNDLRSSLGNGTLTMRLNCIVQFINVNGEESSPIRHFYQNLEEAQYCVSLYMLMRLMGLRDIVILTAYNGQKCLIEDVVKKRCSWNNRIGSPLVSTIDKYQGRQADYVIVSLVRTKNVGYLRDPRRFVVATSRSKLGLYIVGKKSLIQNIKELAVFNTQLNKYPNNLQLRLSYSDGSTGSHGTSLDSHGSANSSNTGASGISSGEEEVAVVEQVLEVRNSKELEDLVKVLM